MLKALGSRLTYANVVATGALFVALGGGAYALTGIPDRSGVYHGCVDPKAGALRVGKTASSCRKTKTVRRAGRRIRILGESAIAWSQQGPRGLQGLQGLQGIQGPQGNGGQQGDRGPSDTWAANIGNTGAASITLPTGRYVAYGAIQFQNTGASPAPDSCSWIATGQGVNRLDGVGPMATVPASGFASTANSSVIDVSGPGTFTLGLFCGVNGSLTPTGQMTVTAVGTLH